MTHTFKIKNSPFAIGSHGKIYQISVNNGQENRVIKHLKRTPEYIPELLISSCIFSPLILHSELYFSKSHFDLLSKKYLSDCDSIRKTHQLKEYHKIEIIRQMINSIRHLHILGIIHCDIKLDNWLINMSLPEASLVDDEEEPSAGYNPPRSEPSAESSIILYNPPQSQPSAGYNPLRNDIKEYPEVVLCDFSVSTHISWKISIPSNSFITKDIENLDETPNFCNDIWGLGCSIYRLIYEEYPMTNNEMVEVKKLLELKEKDLVFSRNKCKTIILDSIARRKKDSIFEEIINMCLSPIEKRKNIFTLCKEFDKIFGPSSFYPLQIIYEQGNCDEIMKLITGNPSINLTESDINTIKREIKFVIKS